VKRVSVEEYIEAKGWSFSYAGREIKLDTCPFCGHQNKLSINADTFLWRCWRPACDRKGNHVTLFKEMGDLHSYEWNKQPSTHRPTMPKELEPIPNIEVMREALYDDDIDEDDPQYEDYETKLHRQLLNRVNHLKRLHNVTGVQIQNYLADERGWDHAAVFRMRLGLTVKWFPSLNRECPALVFPYFERGICTYVKYRSLPPCEKAFIGLKGRTMPIYNQDAISVDMPYLVIVEGEADVLSMLSAGEPNVIGVPGAKLSKPEWTDLLKLAQKRILLFDNDAAGREGAQDFTKKYNLTFHKITLPSFEGKDISDWLLSGHSLGWLRKLTGKNTND
jgi:hypothetical protein